MDMYVGFDCPYCGTHYVQPVTADECTRQMLITCDSDGCDRIFVVEYFAEVHATTYKILKEAANFEK